MGLRNKHYVICIINDRTEEKEVGGGHWSLLVYQNSTHNCYHYDSSPRNMLNKWPPNCPGTSPVNQTPV